MSWEVKESDIRLLFCWYKSSSNLTYNEAVEATADHFRITFKEVIEVVWSKKDGEK